MQRLLHKRSFIADKNKEFSNVLKRIQDKFYVVASHQAYHGLDARRTAQRLYQTFLDDGGAGRFEFLEEMAYLIVTFINEGPAVMNPKHEYYEGMSAFKLKSLLKKYSIVPRVDSFTGSTAVTLSRLSACFPTVVLDFMKKYPKMEHTVGTEKMMELGFVGFQPWFRSLAWFSILPSTFEEEFLGFVKGLLAYQVEVLKVLEPTKDAKELMGRVLMVAQETMKSELIPESDKLGLIEHYLGNDLSTEKMNIWSHTFDERFPDFVGEFN